jgi:hypothetical protein
MLHRPIHQNRGYVSRRLNWIDEYSPAQRAITTHLPKFIVGNQSAQGALHRWIPSLILERLGFRCANH